MKKMISSFGNAVLSREQMKAIQGGMRNADAEAACDASFSVKCSGGTSCTSISGSHGYCECKDNSGSVVDYNECILQ